MLGGEISVDPPSACWTPSGQGINPRMQICGRLRPPGTESIDHKVHPGLSATHTCHKNSVHIHLHPPSDHIAIKKVKLPQTVKLVGAETDKFAITFIVF